MNALEAKGIESGYGAVPILWGVSVSLEQGCLTTLVGSNGAGKTTFLRTLTGLLPVWRGTITFEGRDITRLSPHERVQMGLAMVPEGRHLFTNMTVLENLRIGATPGHAWGVYQQNLDWVFELLPRLKERASQTAGTLSGGEQQMLAIGRALMSQPKVLLFDELSMGLSPRLVLDLFRVIRTLKSRGYTMLLVEQNIQIALAVSDYAYVMSHGRIEIEGKAKDVRAMPAVRKAFLGL